MENRPDIVIKNEKRESMHIDRYGNTSGQKCHKKWNQKINENTRVYVQGYSECRTCNM